MITIKEEVLEEVSAWRIIKHLLIVVVVGFVLEWQFPPPENMKAVWTISAPIMYIAYLGIIFARLATLRKRDERAVEELRAISFEEKQAQLQNLHSVIKRKADEVRKESNAIKQKAIDFEKIANDNATLGEERRTLTSQVHSLGESLANADKEKRTIKQAFDEKVRTLKEARNKETETLLTKLDIAQKEAISLRKKLEAIKREEEERSLRKHRKGMQNSWNGMKGSTEEMVLKMNEKFGKGNWEEYVNR